MYQSMPFFGFRYAKVMKVQCFIDRDPKPTWQLDVRVVGIPKINMSFSYRAIIVGGMLALHALL